MKNRKFEIQALFKNKRGLVVRAEKPAEFKTGVSIGTKARLFDEVQINCTLTSLTDVMALQEALNLLSRCFFHGEVKKISKEMNLPDPNSDLYSIGK